MQTLDMTPATAAAAMEAARATATGVPALDGAPRLRKIDLLKQILANDREIRDLAEWLGVAVVGLG